MRDGGGGCDNPLHVAVASKPWTTLLLLCRTELKQSPHFFSKKTSANFGIPNWNLIFIWYITKSHHTSCCLKKWREEEEKEEEEEERKRGREEEG